MWQHVSSWVFLIVLMNCVRINCGAFITQSIFSQVFTKTPNSLPLRARYWVSYVGPVFDWYSASVPTIIYGISYYTGPHYNATWLYITFHKLVINVTDNSSRNTTYCIDFNIITLILDTLVIPLEQRSCWGVYWFHSVRLSVRPSVCPGCRVRSVTSTVLDGFFPY